jgi:hypothetical protein
MPTSESWPRYQGNSRFVPWGNGGTPPYVSPPPSPPPSAEEQQRWRRWLSSLRIPFKDIGRRLTGRFERQRAFDQAGADQRPWPPPDRYDGPNGSGDYPGGPNGNGDFPPNA